MSSDEVFSKENYQIGYDGPAGDVMIISLPIKKWAADKDYGDILVSGVFVKAERIALKNIQQMRVVEAQKGIIKGPGKNGDGLHLAP